MSGYTWFAYEVQFDWMPGFYGAYIPTKTFRVGTPAGRNDQIDAERKLGDQVRRHALPYLTEYLGDRDILRALVQPWGVIAMLCNDTEIGTADYRVLDN